jgi:hypothetical protein
VVLLPFSHAIDACRGYTLVNATRSESVLGSTEMQVRTLLDNITINGSWGCALGLGL